MTKTSATWDTLTAKKNFTIQWLQSMAMRDGWRIGPRRACHCRARELAEAGVGVPGRGQRRGALWPLAPGHPTRAIDGRPPCSRRAYDQGPLARGWKSSAIRSRCSIASTTSSGFRACGTRRWWIRPGSTVSGVSEPRGRSRLFDGSVAAEHHHHVVALAGRVAADLCGAAGPSVPSAFAYRDRSA